MYSAIFCVFWKISRNRLASIHRRQAVHAFLPYTGLLRGNRLAAHSRPPGDTQVFHYSGLLCMKRLAGLVGTARRHGAEARFGFFFSRSFDVS